MGGYFGSPTAGFGTFALTNTGGSDVFVAKLTDAGSTSSFVWAQRAGGASDDYANALAVSGNNVYLTGAFYSPTADFGPTTLTSIDAGFFTDVFVAKLTDTGSTGSFVWAQRAGGMGNDYGRALAVSGNGVYVAGYFMSPTADFGPVIIPNVGATTGTSDVFVTKLTDAGNTGSFAWAQRAGGTGSDYTTALAIIGTSLYVAGSFNSSTANFGPATLTTAGAEDVFVTKLTDAGNTGSFVWAQRAGGPGSDGANALALGGSNVYVTGGFGSSTANFSAITISILNFYPNSNLGFLASLTDPTLTATTTGRTMAPAQLFPNPARRAVTLRLPAGTAPAPLTLSDALGRPVRRYPAPAGPEATLDLRGLPAGLYLLRGAGPAQRLAVE